jgi:hypothetical protein
MESEPRFHEYVCHHLPEGTGYPLKHDALEKIKGKVRKTVITTTILREEKLKIATPLRFPDNARSSFW